MSGAFDSAFLIKPLFVLFLAKSFSLSKEPIIGFFASKVALSLNSKARGFSVLHTLFSIGSDLCLMLASLNLPLVTKRSISD